MNDIKSNIDKLTKRVSKFSTYIDKSVPSDNSSSRQAPQYRESFHFQPNKKVLYLVVPLIIIIILFILKPKFITKIDPETNTRIGIDFPKLLICTAVASILILFLFNKLLY